MGKKIEALLKKHLYTMIAVVVLVVYWLFKAMGMPEYKLSLDDIAYYGTIVLMVVITCKVIHWIGQSNK